MRKTLTAANRGERVPFKIPRSVQQSIPIQRVWQDGIWQVNGRFSQTWRFADINYSLASYEDQRDMFTSYCGVLNSLPTDAVTKITIHNRRLNSSDFQHSVLMRECGDDLDLYRREYNRVLTEKAAASNNLIQDKYITVSVARKNAEEARAFFHRVDADLSKNLGRLDSGAKALDTYERLRILHDFFRPGEEQFYKFDLNASMRLGHSFKDYIAPDGMKFLSDHFELGGKVGRVLFMRKYSSYIKDDMITSMADFPRTLVLSIDLLPVPTDEAVRDVQSQIMGIESDITRWQQRQNARNNFTAVVPYELEQQRAETKEFLDDLSTRDQRMVYANVTLLHMADTLEQLDADTETLLSKSLCDFSILRYQQEDGFRALNIQKDGTGKEIWMPVARNGLQNKEPIEILAQFNGEIRGIYNYYRLARNVSVLNKFCYVMEYSMYKTIARKMRCSAAKVKKKYTRDRIFGIEYETKHGIKRAEFYHNGFRKSAPSKLDMDTTPDYRYSIRPKEVIARFMTGYCELCCKNELPVMIYQVKNLKSLSGNEPWEQFMLKKRRKTLIVCEDCYKTITNS